MQILHWHKSTYSGDSSNCVEIARAPTRIYIRDSKTLTARYLTITPSTWEAFVSHAREAAGAACSR
ncbi:DUF397 domain-containing protein [Streptomyces sp. NPDC048106]|uniref:DUF397 domain-containing protein n=1 Tax=Streptomyces sp. NPDC048106 TaxID=3155750 RepID=UPI0034526B5A